MLGHPAGWPDEPKTPGAPPRQGIGPVAHDHFTERAESGWHVAPDEIGGFIDAACDFDHERFGLGGHEASQMDPQQRLLMTLAWAALEQAGMPPAGSG